MKHALPSERSSTDVSATLLLEDEKDDYELERDSFMVRSKTSRQYRWIQPLIIQLVLISLYTGAYFLALRSSTRAKTEDILIDTPARSAVKPDVYSFDYRPTSAMKYFDKPSEVIDRNWDEILDFSNIKFSKEDMISYGRGDEGVLLSDDTGYLGTLNVFHELHCIKRIYMTLYKEQYFPNLTAFETRFNMHHAKHCLDVLRQGVQCRVDVSPVTYQWGQFQRLPVANFSSPHECRNWPDFMMWAKENSFDPTWPGLVVHPKYGDAYVEEDSLGAKLGIVQDKPEGDDDHEMYQ